MAKFGNGAVIVAGYKDKDGTTEFFDQNEPIQTMWQEKMQTAEFKQFDGFAMVGFKDQVFLFGGQTLDGGDQNSVFRMHGSYVWERESYTMTNRRTQFRALANGKKIFEKTRN